MNQYKLRFNVVRDIPGETEQQDLGTYDAIVEAPTAGEAERKALDELIKANVGSRHHYLFNRMWDLGPVPSDNQETGPS